MKSKTKSYIESIIGIVIGGLFLYITFRNKSISEIIESIKNANLYWVLSNGLFLLIALYFRSLRWRILLENAGFYPKKLNVLNAVALGYFVNSFTPKLGEIIRCTSLKKTSDIPVTKSFGTVVSERIYDLIVLVIGLVIIGVFEIKRLHNLFAVIKENSGQASFSPGNIMIAIILACILLYLLYRIFKKSNFVIKLKDIVKDIIRTARSTFKLKKYKQFIVLTFFIWLSLIIMNYCCLRALPETENFNLYFAAVTLFIGGLGWLLPSPGGIGTSHFFILQLFLVFNLSEKAGLSFAVLSNGLTFVFTILFGIIAIILNKFRKT